MLTGCYKFKAMRMDVTGVYTNKMSTDAYRGAGRPEATYAIERMLDIVANELQSGSGAAAADEFPDAVGVSLQDRVRPRLRQWQLRRRARQDAAASIGWNALLDRRAVARREGKLFGVGVSTYVEICALGPVEGDGRRWMGVGLRPHRVLGQGHGDYRRDAARPGTGNELCADRRRSPRHADGRHRRALRRYERRALRPRHLRQPRDGAGRHRDRHVHRQDPRQSATTLAAHICWKRSPPT